MDALRFRIRHPNAAVEEVVTESQRVLIGSGAHCDVRLPLDEARVEHVLISATPAGLRIAARSFDPPPKLDGIEFTEAPIRGEAVLLVGRTRIDLTPWNAVPGQLLSARGSRAIGPRLYAYLFIGVVGSGLIYAARRHPQDGAAEPVNVPGLWARSEQGCPQVSRDRAEATANERLRLAQAKQERSPFHPEDGVQAVPLYQAAVACFRAAGSWAQAEDAAASAERLRRQMDEEFRGHRLRLQRAIALQHWGSARRESGILLWFLPTNGGEYWSWLSNLHRKLQLSYGSNKD